MIIAIIVPIFGLVVAIASFYLNKPDLQIETNKVGHVDWNNLEYCFNIKNYGKSTAKDVEVRLDLNYWKGQISRIKELPAGEHYRFSFQAAPPMPVTLPNPFLDYFKKILSGEKSAVGTIIIKYKWLVASFNAKYDLVIDKDSAMCRKSEYIGLMDEHGFKPRNIWFCG